MEDDLRKNLLKKNSNFDKAYEECVVKIQRIKQRNDALQRQIGTQLEESVKAQVNNQKKFIEKEVTELKNLIQHIQQKFKDPQSKNKIKKIKEEAHKQIQRNKIILKDLINRSFAVRSSSGRQAQQENSENLMEGGKISYDRLEDRTNDERYEEQVKGSLLTVENMEVDFDLQRKIMLEKNEMINEVEQSTLRINEIMNDMGILVDEQGQNLDIIEDELLKTNQNMISANKELDEASSLQKKARKKYVIMIGIIVVVVIAVAGILVFTLT